MQIRIEIDVKPEELRRFLGVPNVADIRDDFAEYLKTKAGEVVEAGPGNLIKNNLDMVRNIVKQVVVREVNEAPAKSKGKRSR